MTQPSIQWPPINPDAINDCAEGSRRLPNEGLGRPCSVCAHVNCLQGYPCDVCVVVVRWRELAGIVAGLGAQMVDLTTAMRDLAARVDELTP